MMKKLLWIFSFLLLSLASEAQSYVSVNFDYETEAAIVEALGVQAGTEEEIHQLWDDITDSYKKSEIATAGLYLIKHEDREALKAVGIFGSTESYYYKHIRMLVAEMIMPKLIQVGLGCLNNPDQVLFWGPYLFNVTEDVLLLCKVFQTVVTNSRVSFNDLNFLQVAEPFRALFDLARYGNIDWRAFWEDLSNTVNINGDDLKNDFTMLSGAVASVATAGDSIIHTMFSDFTNAGKIFKSRPDSLLTLLGYYKGMYDTFRSPAACQQIFMSYMPSLDSLSLGRIFQLANYTVDDFIAQYVTIEKKRYYRQKWMIRYRDQGDELVDRYDCPDPTAWTVLRQVTPWKTNFLGGGTSYPAADYDLAAWISTGWFNVVDNASASPYNFNVPDLSGSDLDVARDLALSQTDWSMSRIDELNNNGDKYTYYLQLTPRIVYTNILNAPENLAEGSAWGTPKPGQNPSSIYGAWFRVATSVGYSVEVRRKWDVEEVVYEETFDSKTMVFENFHLHMEGELARLRQEEQSRRYEEYYEGKKYENYQLLPEDGASVPQFELVSEAAMYYDTADQTRIAGSQSVEFIMDCGNGLPLLKGSHSWKINEHHPEYPKDYLRFAMETSKTPNTDLLTARERLDECNEQIASIDKDIATLKAQQNDIFDALATASGEERNVLQRQFDSNKATLGELNRMRNSYDEARQQVQQHYDAIYAEYSLTPDEDYRIPAIMRELETKHRFTWTEDGHWEGTTYVRPGRIDAIDLDITFRCDVLQLRDETWVDCGLFSLRIHRAIMELNWNVFASYSSSDVVDVITFDDDMSVEDRTALVDQRVQQLLDENPGCTVTLRYKGEKKAEEDDDEDVVHLLWMSDRLAVAREVDSRLIQIYAGLVRAEMTLRYRHSVLEYFGAPFYDAVRRGMRGELSNKSLERWRNASHFNNLHKEETVSDTLTTVTP